MDRRIQLEVPEQHFQRFQSVQVSASAHLLQSKLLHHLHLQRHYTGPDIRQNGKLQNLKEEYFMRSKDDACER